MIDKSDYWSIIMSEQIVMPMVAGAVNSQYRQKAQEYLEKARLLY